MNKLSLLTLAVAGVFIALTVAASSAGGVSQEKITICHAAGLEGTTKYVTLTLAYPAVYGPAGHFNENGTTRAGHEQDYLGECVPPVTTTAAPTTTTAAPTTTTTTTDEPESTTTTSAVDTPDTTVGTALGSATSLSAPAVPNETNPVFTG